MNPLYEKEFLIEHSAVDCFGRLRPSRILDMVQQVSGDHSVLLGAGQDVLTEKDLFWAVIRHRVHITRLPGAGEKVTLQTWPMPTTRTAYPRSVVAYDAAGNECFRAISLWVLMEGKSRAMVVPGKSGVTVSGMLTGAELAAPGSLVPKPMSREVSRTVRYTDLDINGHMNNCRYLDWVADVLPSAFHRQHSTCEFTVCYLSEAREEETLTLGWELTEGPCLTVQAQRPGQSPGHSRVFAAQVRFG